MIVAFALVLRPTHFFRHVKARLDWQTCLRLALIPPFESADAKHRQSFHKEGRIGVSNWGLWDACGALIRFPEDREWEANHLICKLHFFMSDFFTSLFSFPTLLCDKRLSYPKFEPHFHLVHCYFRRHTTPVHLARLMRSYSMDLDLYQGIKWCTCIWQVTLLPIESKSDICC